MMRHGQQARYRRWRMMIVLVFVLPAMASGDQLEIRLDGDFPALRQNVKAFLGEVEDRNADRLRRFADQSTPEVERALRALGYYQPDINWEVKKDDPPKLTLTIKPGKPVRIKTRTVEVRGPAAEDDSFAPIPREWLKVGDVLNHSDYESVKGTIRNHARRLGYFDGRFTESRLRVDPEALAAHITLIYESGQRFRLGDVSFEEGHGFDEDLLRRFVQFESGSRYHADKLAELNSDLSNSGYFAQVIVDASPQDAKDQSIPVVVRLSRRERRSVSAGLGFSTDVGPRVRGTWTEHWINPQGHRRHLETELAAPRQSLSTWYEIPLDPPMTDSLRFTGGYQREDIEDVESERVSVGTQWEHGMDNGWKRILSLRWEGERFQIGNNPTEQSSLLLPGVSYSKLSADSPMDPSRGYRLQVEAVGGNRDLFSDVDVAQLTGLARGLMTVGNGHRFLARFKAGAVATNDFSNVPPSLRFFAGGDQSVRGYAYQTLSPEDAAGNEVGGRYLLVGSFEYQFPLTDTWRLAAFVDEGNALDDFSDPLATGVGVGVRWVSPVGPIRLDVAKGLDDEFGGGFRVHFSMGPEL
ncbi:MAG: outer membrane protein assembly factor [Oleiphilaceae bacterium]|nr:outer membrane protein assembly factor [Oleiphilaceae bacterium]